VDTLGDSSVNLRVFIWAPSRVWWSVRTQMLWDIKKALEDGGIDIPFPQRVVTISRATRDAVPLHEGQEAEHHG